MGAFLHVIFSQRDVAGRRCVDELRVRFLQRCCDGRDASVTTQISYYASPISVKTLLLRSRLILCACSCPILVRWDEMDPARVTNPELNTEFAPLPLNIRGKFRVFATKPPNPHFTPRIIPSHGAIFETTNKTFKKTFPHYFKRL